MHINTTIIVATVIILATGVYQATVVKSGSTVLRVTVGAYIFAIIASVVTLVFPASTRVINALMMVTVLAVLLSAIPDLAKRITGKGFSA